MDTVYKKKNQKVKLVNLNKLDDTKLRGYTNWKKRVIETTQT